MTAASNHSQPLPDLKLLEGQLYQCCFAHTFSLIKFLQLEYKDKYNDEKIMLAYTEKSSDSNQSTWLTRVYLFF